MENRLVKTLQLIAILFTAVTMSAGWAHLLSLPNKIALPGRDYLIVQQIYQGWAYLGIAVVSALISTLTLTVVQYKQNRPFSLSLGAAICIAFSLIVFFLLTYPANRITQNWTMLPIGWEALRRQWEYSHAAGALLDFAALILLAISLIFDRH